MHVRYWEAIKDPHALAFVSITACIECAWSVHLNAYEIYVAYALIHFTRQTLCYFYICEESRADMGVCADDNSNESVSISEGWLLVCGWPKIGGWNWSQIRVAAAS